VAESLKTKASPRPVANQGRNEPNDTTAAETGFNVKGAAVGSPPRCRTKGRAAIARRPTGRAATRAGPNGGEHQGPARTTGGGGANGEKARRRHLITCRQDGGPGTRRGRVSGHRASRVPLIPVDASRGIVGCRTCRTLLRPMASTGAPTGISVDPPGRATPSRRRRAQRPAGSVLGPGAGPTTGCLGRFFRRSRVGQKTISRGPTLWAIDLARRSRFP